MSASDSSSSAGAGYWIVAVIGLVGIGIVVLFIFWRLILRWAHNSLIPWIRSQNLPRLEEIATDALVFLDRARSAVTDLARRAWEAWKKLRTLLVSQVMRFRKVSGTTRVVSSVENWIREPRDTNVVNHQVMEANVNWNELPSDVLIALIERGEYTVDVVDAREREFMEMGYTS